MISEIIDPMSYIYFQVEHHSIEEYQLPLDPSFRLQKFSPYSDYSLLERPCEDESSMMSQFLSVSKLNVTKPIGSKDH